MKGRKDKEIIKASQNRNKDNKRRNKIRSDLWPLLLLFNSPLG